jgi:uncharacterized coiled-coil DUF342 family protein
LRNVEVLKEKIDTLIKLYQDMKKENDSLRNQLVASQGQNESLSSKTRGLEDNLSNNDNEIDTILEKINNITN